MVEEVEGHDVEGWAYGRKGLDVEADGGGEVGPPFLDGGADFDEG